MHASPSLKPPAVCSWSLQARDPRDLAAKLRLTGITRVQLALDPLRETPSIWRDAGEVLRQHGVEMVSGMFGCVGEDYATLESIRRTGGIAPDATWEKNLENIRATARLAARMELGLVTFHAGFLPHDEADPDFAKMLGRLAVVASVFAEKNIALGLETGQETAPSLAVLLQKLGRTDVGVNFDPANMILYGRGDPVEAVGTLGPWIRQVHLKDATRAASPGAWGEEVRVGTGQVDWPGFFRALQEVHFSGNFVIEREAGTRRIADICAAREVFERLNG